MNRFFTLFLAASCLTAVGQCDADYDFGDALFGIASEATNSLFSDSLESVVVGSPYHSIFHLKTPQFVLDIDPTLPFNADTPLDSASLSSIVLVDLDDTLSTTTLEAVGLEVICNNNGDSGNPCSFLGASQYCGTITGAPEIEGSYRLDFYVSSWVTLFGFPFSQESLWGSSYLTVVDECIDGFDVLGVCGGSCSADADADGICDDEDDCIGELDACGICNGPGAIYECGCADIPEGDCDCEGNTIDLVGVCGGSCTSDHDNNGVCDDQEVFGCAYPLADNYSPEVTHDDGSCVFPCVGEVNANVFDWDGDYSVTVTDFLMMLTVFGDVDVDFDGVWDSADECIDTEACNYNADPSEPCQYIDVLGICGGGCPEDADADGVCDDVDDCIGVVDECGVCNGPGATEVVIEGITILYDSVYAEQIDTWFVFEVGADTTFSYQCDPSLQFSCGDPVSYQGYDYQTVQIGEQCWFAENLRVESYRNGDAIPSGLSDTEWSSTSIGAVAVYFESASNLETYGRLYNYQAVEDDRGLCQSGWHIPTDEDWMTMEMVLGMSEIVATSAGYRGTNQGSQMKTDYGWYSGNGASSNSSGFSGLPGGLRSSSSGVFYDAGDYGYWWSSSASGSNAWLRGLTSDREDVNRGETPRRTGFSVRCIKDSE